MANYPLGGAVFRSDLRGVVQEAALQSELYIGIKAMPPLPVTVRNGQYPKFSINRGNLLRDEATRRADTANYPRVTRAYERDTYNCVEWGLEGQVGDVAQEDMSRFFDLEASEATRLQVQIQLGHERRVKAKLFDPSAFNTTTSATAYTLANLGTANLGLDVDTARQQIQSRGESISNLTGVMSLNVFNRMRASTQLINRVRGVQSSDTSLVLGEQQVAAALGLDQILVGKAVYDASKQNSSTSSLLPIWTDDYIWIGNVSNPTNVDDYFGGGAGFTLFWQQDADIFQVETYREEQTRSEIIRVRQFTDEKIVLGNGGQLLATQYS